MSQAKSKGRSAKETKSQAASDWTGKGIAKVIENERLLKENEEPSERIIERITHFCGSVPFIWVHAAGFAAWIGANILLPAHYRWDPYPFTFLTLVVSLEAIFLSTFILVTANRDAAVAERRMHLDLQINLLAERENTKMLILLSRIAKRVGAEVDDDPEEKEMENEVDPNELLEKIDQFLKNADQKPHTVSRTKL